MLRVKSIVDKKELMSGRNNIASSLAVDAAMRILRINEVNAIYDRFYHNNEDFATQVLASMNVKTEVSQRLLSNIPATGSAIVISNHPTGALDGLLLIDMLTKIRPDVKFMGNFLLDRIETLSRYFISVDPFDSGNRAMNQKGVKLSLEHLRDGGLLVIFPAGEVSTWQKGVTHIADKQWISSVLKFIRKAQVPVIPLNIEAHNSLLFHIAGKINPKLRTAFLPRELLNKRDKCVPIHIGSAIKPSSIPVDWSLAEYGNFLRANVDYMRDGGEHKRQRRRIYTRKKRLPEMIASQIEMELILDELNRIASSKLHSSGSYDIYFSAPDNIPHIIKEIGRLREITFRSIGEGTMSEADNDHYDNYYHQLFIWDNAANRIVGAYRMGMGKEISQRLGIRGFYTDTLFKMGEQMGPVLENSIEMGRSFIVDEYQRKALPLKLLWKGILSVLLNHPEYRYLMGAASVSGEFSRASKQLIINFLRNYHYASDMAPHIRPVYGTKGISSKIDLKLVQGVDNIELISKLVYDIEKGERSMPVLILKYIALGSRVLAFNIDPYFNNSLDALIILDLEHVPKDVIKMLSK